MSTPKYTFKKLERLCGEIAVSRLFAEGQAFIVYPYRVVYKKVPLTYQNECVRVLMSAPKKRFKHAVDRNLIKRRMREAYRLHKQDLYTVMLEKDFKLQLAFNYVANEALSFADMEIKMQKAFRQLNERLQ